MKKNFKRNKILLTSLIGLAVVASASVAFSTWIFGLNKESETVDGIKVEVDGYKDTTKYIDIAAVANETIKLAEYSSIKSSTDNIAYTEGITTETDKGDFNIALSKFEFAYSTEQFNFENITFKMVVYKGTATETDINKVDSNSVHDEAVEANNTVKMRENKADGYQYLSLATATINIGDLTTWFDDATIGSYTYYSVKKDKNTLSLKWSDYFGSDSVDGIKASPAIFYNNAYKTYKDKTVKEKLQFLNTANSEMKAMQKIFEDTANIRIKITAKLNVTEKTPAGGE